MARTKTDTKDTPGDSPLEACNENGPYPQTIALLAQSYPTSYRPATRCDITTSGMTLTVDVQSEWAGEQYIVTPGDNSGTYPQITTDATGAGTTSYDYTAEGTYTVIVAVVDDDGGQSVVAQLDVMAVDT